MAQCAAGFASTHRLRGGGAVGDRSSPAIRPSVMRIVRWAYAATLGSWVTRMTVIPSALSCWNIRRISTLVCESRLPVGSSARRTRGVIHQCTGDGHPLLLPARHLRRLVVGPVGKSDAVEQACGQLPGFGSRPCAAKHSPTA